MKDLKQLWKNIKKENPFCISFNNFVAHNLVNYFDIENRFLPVFIEDKKVQFTNVSFNENSSGDDYFLVLIGNTYKFLKYYYEPDCDGAYYGVYIVDLFDTRNTNQYTFVEVYTNDIIKLLNNY